MSVSKRGKKGVYYMNFMVKGIRYSEVLVNIPRERLNMLRLWRSIS